MIILTARDSYQFIKVGFLRLARIVQLVKRQVLKESPLKAVTLLGFSHGKPKLMRFYCTPTWRMKLVCFSLFFLKSPKVKGLCKNELLRNN